MSTKLQKCAGKGPTDYWGRLLAESLTADEPRDQPILRAIKGVGESKLSLDDLATQLYASSEFSRRFEHFGSLFDSAKLPNLASSFYDVIRHRMGRNYSRDDIPGFFAIWRLMEGRHAARYEPSLEAWALEEILKCLPNHIHLANELYYFWLGGPEAPPERMVAARKAILEKLQASLQGKTNPSLCECLNENYPYNLFHLFYTINYKEKAKGMAPLSDDADWAWLRPNLLAASHQCPPKMLPQIIIALQHEEGRGGPETLSYEFDRPRLDAVFGEHSQELLTLIASGFTINPAFDPATAQRIKLSIEKAKSLVSSPS